jgi:hypothetical protein
MSEWHLKRRAIVFGVASSDRGRRASRRRRGGGWEILCRHCCLSGAAGWRCRVLELLPALRARDAGRRLLQLRPVLRAGAAGRRVLQLRAGAAGRRVLQLRAGAAGRRVLQLRAGAAGRRMLPLRAGVCCRCGRRCGPMLAAAAAGAASLFALNLYIVSAAIWLIILNSGPEDEALHSSRVIT